MQGAGVVVVVEAEVKEEEDSRGVVEGVGQTERGSKWQVSDVVVRGMVMSLEDTLPPGLVTIQV
jgi:hypothetical protein